MITQEQLVEIGRKLGSVSSEIYDESSEGTEYTCWDNGEPEPTQDTIENFIDAGRNHWNECAKFAQINIAGYPCLVSSKVQVEKGDQRCGLTVLDVGFCRLHFDFDIRDFI